MYKTLRNVKYWIRMLFTVYKNKTFSKYEYFLANNSRFFTLTKGTILGTKACMGQIAALVLLKLFIIGNDTCHTINAPSACA